MTNKENMENKKYVIYIGTVFLPDKNAAAQRAMMICNSYKDIGKIPIIIGVNNDKEGTDLLSSYCEYNGISTYSTKYPNTNSGWLRRFYEISSIVKIIEQYGVNNIHSLIIMDYMALALWRLMKYCSKRKIRVVVDTVDWFSKSLYAFPKNIIKDIDTLIRMKYLHKKAKYMVTISEYLFNYYKDAVPRIRLIPATINIRDEKWASVKKYAGNEIKTFGYAGDPGKKFEKERLDWMIKVISELNQEGKKCRLKIAGVNKDDLLENFTDLLSLPFVNSNVEFLGRIPHTESLDMIASCDFSVIIRENILLNKAGFPTKLSESFGCGTPVIATPSGDVGKYINNEFNGFLTTDFTYASLKELTRQVIDIEENVIFTMHDKTMQENPLKYQNYTDSILQLVE
ncbi:glycosyltransferase [Paenibacillus sp. CN-4]|uniref:glycosyltransferase n=1 Tax=Paenibacillus nanchangensis TaxID=3348343 RepID=UPI003978DF0F